AQVHHYSVPRKPALPRPHLSSTYWSLVWTTAPDDCLQKLIVLIVHHHKKKQHNSTHVQMDRADPPSYSDTCALAYHSFQNLDVFRLRSGSGRHPAVLRFYRKSPVNVPLDYSRRKEHPPRLFPLLLHHTKHKAKHHNFSHLAPVRGSFPYTRRTPPVFQFGVMPPTDRAELWASQLKFDHLP